MGELQESLKNEIKPQHVFRPADGLDKIDPPVETRYQELPFHKLSWEDFERLCFRMAGKNTRAEYWQRYGRQGQAQGGIDIFVRLTCGKYETWQCKRYKKFDAAKIKDAVDIFLAGDWKDRTASLFLCVTASLDDTAIQNAVETQAKRLKKEGIIFHVDGVERLSEKLKAHPDLVDDFFGRVWLKVFCGGSTVNMLSKSGHHLDGVDISRLRYELFNFYNEYFQTVDRGLIGSTNQSIDIPSPPSLLDRFIVPDVMIREATSRVDFSSQPEPKKPEPNEAGEHKYPGGRDEGNGRIEVTTEQYFRRPMGDWIAERTQVAVLGDAGSGKSTLLRCMTLDLLSGQSVFPKLAQTWGQHIPILIPFARWTQMVASQANGVPIEDMLSTWLRQFSMSTEVLELVCKALKDKRLLLLVDGLDEWANETAAHSVLAQIETVVRTQSIPAVLCGRPLGVAKLGGLGGHWHTASLAPLTENQQKELATIWFGAIPSATKSASQPGNQTTHNQFICWQVENFFKDLRDGGQLHELAGTPLLLTGLISLRLRQVNLPRNRFQAYGELTKLLLETHPQERSSAAADGTSRFHILDAPETRQRALARLAYEIRFQGADSGFPVKDAKRIIVEFLRDEDEVGLPSDKAHLGASELLAVNAETSGILIEKAPQEVGFIHAVFEEHLTATYIAGQTMSAQQEFIASNCSDPRWRNVILGLFRQLTRSSDVDQLITEIENAQVSGSGEVVRRLLLAEAAFGESNCSPRTAKCIASSIFEVIETGSWMPERKALLRIALEGFSNGALNGELSQHLFQWCPQSQSRWDLGTLFNVLEHWPRERALAETLWKGLFDPEFKSRRAAARTLAKVYAGDLEIGNRLLHVVCTPIEPEIAATILESLIIGWSDIDGLTAIIDAARLSKNKELLFAGIYGSSQQGRHTEQDLEALLWLSNRSNAPYWIRSDLADALLDGWPSSDLVLEKCLPAWREKNMSWDGISDEIAQRVLLLGYADNNCVVDQLCELLSDNEHSLFGFHEPWDELKASFFRHPIVGPAFDAWIEKNMDEKYQQHVVASAALVSGSDTAKQYLLSSLKDAGDMISWPVSVLLEIWGMQDKQVAKALTALANVESEQAQYIAPYLPEIIRNKKECRCKLLNIGRSEKFSRPDFLVQGFVKLGVTHTDHEAMDVILPYLEGDSSILSPTGTIIRYFGIEDRIQNFAKSLLADLDAPLPEMAYAYQDDSEMRALILKRATPLPSALRQVIVSHAKRRCDEVTDLDQVLSSYGSEENAEVRTSTEIAYYETFDRRGKDIESAVALLTEELRSVGPIHDSLRQSALAGLISLGRIESFQELKEAYDDDRPLTVSAVDASRNQNDILLECITLHWEEIYKVLGDSIFDRLNGVRSGNQNYCWNALSTYVRSSLPFLQEAFLDYCRHPESKLGAGSLRALARLDRAGSLLLECCKRVFDSVSPYSAYDEVATQITAGTILGEQFSSENNLKEMLEHIAHSQNNSGAAIALSLGWPESKVLDAIYDAFKSKKSSRITWPVAFYVVGLRDDSDAFERLILSFSNRANGGIWEFHSVCAEVITQKLSQDEELYARLFARLINDASFSEQVSLSRLLSMSRSGDQELREWCEKEISYQMNGKKLPDCGFDVVSGRVRPLTHTLLDILVPYGLPSAV